MEYIFFEYNTLDMRIKSFQENIDNFDICTSLAIEYTENS